MFNVCGEKTFYSSKQNENEMKLLSHNSPHSTEISVLIIITRVLFFA